MKNKNPSKWFELHNKIFDWILFIITISTFLFLPLLIISEKSPLKEFVDINKFKLEFQLSFLEAASNISNYTNPSTYRARKQDNFTLFETENIDDYYEISNLFLSFLLSN